MRFGVLKVKGNSMHPALESGAFVLVWHSSILFGQNKVLSRLPVIGDWLTELLKIKKGDVIAVRHPKYGLIIKRVVKVKVCPIGSMSISQKQPNINSILQTYNSGGINNKSKNNNNRLEDIGQLGGKNIQSFVRYRLKGDNFAESVTETAMGWLQADEVVGKVVYSINK